MTDTARHLHDAKPSLFSTQSRTQRQIDALKSKAAGALRSPYVKGGLILGVAAAGYALVRHNKAAAHRKVDKVVSYVPLAARTAPRAPRAVERPPSAIDILKVGSLLLSVVGSLVSATGNARVESAPASAGKPVPLRSADESTDGGAAPPAAGAPAEPVFEKPAASWLGRQWQIIKGAAVAWIDDFAPSMGAALSYYTLFSLAPLLVIVIAIAGLVFGHDAAQGAIVAQLGGIMGKEGATAVQGLLKAAQEPSTGIVASIVGFVLLLVGATAIFAELQSDLDRIWRAPAKKNESGLWSWLRSRVLSFGLILGLAFMLMVSLVVSAALSASSAWLGGSAAESLIFTVLNFLASLGIFTVLFAMIYKIMPNVKISWHDVWTGAFVTALLFNIGKSLIGLYLAKSNVASGFGAAGSFVILVAWFYYSAQIFLFGAEYTWVHANSRKRQHA